MLCSDEHQRRSPDCTFFTLYASIKGKPGRPKKGRASKASRLSTRSNPTVASDDPSVVETEQNPDETVMSTTESVKPTKTVRGKTAGKAKKAISKPKGKGSKTKQEVLQIASSFLEPEDDNFEVKIAPSPALVSSNKKRKSGEISTINEGQSILQDSIGDIQRQELAKRQRRTRASSVVTQTQEKPISAPADEAKIDARMTDAEEMLPAVRVSKMKGKGAKKRGSSVARKASSASTASKASLRAKVPDDNDIDAALEAELDRPLTDEEDEAETEQPKTRRLTRNKPLSKKATASVAPTRRGIRAGSVNAVDSSDVDLHPTTQSVPLDEGEQKAENQANGGYATETAEVCLEVKRSKSKRSRNSPEPQLDKKDGEEPSRGHDAIADGGKVQGTKQEATPRQTRERQASRQLPIRNTRASSMTAANDAVDQRSDINSSMLDTQTVQDDSGHETDASVLKQNRTKSRGKKAPAPAKKAKRGKKVGKAQQKVEVVPQEAAVEVQSNPNENETQNEASDFSGRVEPNATAAEPSKKRAKETKVTKASKAKGTGSKAKVAPRKPSTVASPEQPEPVMEVQDTPASVPPPSTHSTPRSTISPQSSDAENQPPSSRPSSFRPPLAIQSPSKSQMTKIPLAVTPITSPSKSSFSKLQSTFSWTAIDMEHIFRGTPSADKENNPFVFSRATEEGIESLTSPEKKLTVEEWIQFNAQRGEERLRNECERLVGKFEGEGVRALKTLEGIVCAP